MEIWKDVVGYEGLYKVSNLGRVKRIKGAQAKSERVLKPINNGTNYMGVSLSKDSKVKKFYIHRLVAIAFIDNELNKSEVNHIDGDRQNNKLSNLEWVNRSENHNHRYQVLKQRGVNLGKKGKLNWCSKRVIQLDLNGNYIKTFDGVSECMRKTGINESNIRGAIYGRRQTTAGGYRWKYE